MVVGGAQENTLFTVSGLAERGHQVTLVTGPSPGPEGELLKREKYHPFEIVENPHLVRELSPFHDTMAYLSLKKFIKERKFDVVHTHSSKAGIAGRAAAWAAKTPFVAHTIHGQAFHRNEKHWKNLLYINAEKWAAKRCHKIYAVAQAMIDQCLEQNIAPASMFKVVYSGMRLEPFLESKRDDALAEKLGIPKDAKVAGAVARLFPLKGYEDFIPAAIKIAKDTPAARFLIVGDGIMMDDLKNQIRAAGMADKFIFAGLVPPAEVHRYISLMDVLVHLSMREGLPRAVAQALASGKPAISYNLDGAPEVVLDDRTGYLTNPGEVDKTASLVRRLFADSALAEKLGAAGRALVRDRFDWRKMVDILEAECFDNLIV
jgi:glycosyltransferase involved in cell wall biosynthesis